MKRSNPTAISTLFLLLGALAASHAQAQSTNLQLRLESRTNGLDLRVNGSADSGAFFLYQAFDLQSLLDSPTVAVQTNTPLTNGLRFSIPKPSALPSQMFFTAAHWPGRTLDDFGDPENYPEDPAPEAVLVTSGVPDNLISGQQFTADFFVMTPEGHLLDLTQAVSILVLRQSDGVSHPDAQVSPATGQLVGGHLRMTMTITASTSLEGYTLGLGPSVSLSKNASRLTLAQFLKAAFNVTGSFTNSSHSNQLYQLLEDRRVAARDTNPVWAYPLSGGGHPVSGTFGEWRGDENKRIHAGLDLAATHSEAARASRGGVVSALGTVSISPPMGDFVTIDHGDGWFSRYLHLQASQIGVKVGQVVQRGDTLATNLFTWSREHLHFEIRRTNNISQWNVGTPGSGQDPLQIGAINPDSAIFPESPVPPGVTLPALEEIGLTRQHPATNAFSKSTPADNATGPVFVVAKFLDKEPKTGGFRRLSLRAIGFQPEGISTNNWIWTSNETAIAALLPPLNGTPSVAMQKGFARYKLITIVNPNTGGTTHVASDTDYYRYWWKWDTSSYTNATGPRTNVLTGVDYGNATSNYTFTFGPQIKSNALVQVSALQYRFTNVAYLGATTPAALGNAALFVQPDRYKLQILKTNGQPLEGVAWMEGGTALSGNTPLSRPFSTHTNEQTYTFTLPQNTDIGGLKLRVSSVLVTNIAHEICLCGGPDMAFIPAGPFTMGSDEYPGYGEQPIHTVQVGGFCMDKYEVTKALWDEVYQWAITHGYDFNNPGLGKAATHPVHTVSWYDTLKWCNARSEKEGRVPAYYTSAAQTGVYRSGQVNVQNDWAKWNTGYRLPTEAEWEKASRGGLSGRRFPWGDTITHAQANYYSSASYAYDISPTRNYHPTYATGGLPYTSPAGSFAANGYGLYDMAGNVREWCWDWYGSTYYSSSPGIDPRGPATGSHRVVRGGSWYDGAFNCRTANRYDDYPTYRDSSFGFRSVLPPGQP